jgi:acyl-CoA synthetase (AMP-forming)/AMP-acid ligase II
MNTWAALLHEAHRAHADQAAVITDTGALTYAQVLEDAHRAAAWLHAAGLEAGARVVLALDNRPEMVALERALALWGFVRVAVSARLHPKEIAYIVDDCAAAAVFCEPRLAPGVRARDIVLVSSTACEAAPHTLADVFAQGARMQTPSPPRIEPQALCSLMYTSGTTGRPKGAMNTHGAWHAMATNLLDILPPAGPGDVLLHAAPMSHFSGSVSSAFLASGAAIAMLARFDPRTAGQEARRVGATCMPLVPTMLNDLTRALKDGGEPMPSSLKVIPYGGSPIATRALADARATLGPVLLQIYGASEALIPVTSLSADGHAPGSNEAHRLASAGVPHPAVAVRIADPVDGIGEICVRGANVMSGYWDKPAESANVLDASGWYRSGDLGRMDDDGRVAIVGRRREMLISGGFNIYPAEVERVIADLRGVREVAVVGAPHPRWGEAVSAYIVREPGAAVSAQDIVDGCLAQLASYKKPLHIEFVDALPRTTTGKIDKLTLGRSAQSLAVHDGNEVKPT